VVDFAGVDQVAALAAIEHGRRARPTAKSTRKRGALETADPQNSAFYQKDRASRHLGEPELLAEIEYRAKSAEGKVRAR
jgi:hypothetical protein